MVPFRLLTYNVKFLPDIARWPQKFWEEMLPDPQRAKRIAAALRRKKRSWDVVCLQEVFDEDQRGVLLAQLRAKRARLAPGFRAFHAKADDGDFLHEDSGLFVASRHRIGLRRFHEYAATAGADAWADKGVLALRLDTERRLGCKLVVFTTHMQADAHHGRTRSKQAHELERFMRKTLSRLKEPERHAVLLCGDFNIIGEAVDVDGTLICPTQEYVGLLSLFADARDLYREAHPRAVGATWNPRENDRMIRSRASRHERLDYLFAIDSLPNIDEAKPRLRFRRLEALDVSLQRFPNPSTKFLSDHYGVGADLRLHPES
ncbi:MAG: endonuclease/exonuclease/phosphatase family protein [Myxococcales bacterium]|nr:endonuclease/exonuclease/phosphatase family protein [Myxococcales bacterium]